MAFDIGINFRATVGYVSDGANETYCLAEAYPTTRGGVTFGWESAIGGSRDRDNTNDRRLAGINFDNTVGHTFRIDLPSAGTYDVHAAAGDGSHASGNGALWDLQDGTTTFASLTVNQLSADEFKDAADAALTLTTWPGSEVAVSRTFASTIFRLKVRAVAVENNVIAHVRVVQTGGGATHGLFRQADLSGLGGGGPFFSNPLN